MQPHICKTMDFGWVLSAGFVCVCARAFGPLWLKLQLLRSSGEVPRQSNHEVGLQLFSNCQVSWLVRPFQYSIGLTSCT